MILTMFAFFSFSPLLQWIDKWSSRESLLEHLESSGIKIMMTGPFVLKLCVERKKETNKEPNTQTWGVSDHNAFCAAYLLL